MSAVERTTEALVRHHLRGLDRLRFEVDHAVRMMNVAAEHHLAPEQAHHMRKIAANLARAFLLFESEPSGAVESLQIRQALWLLDQYRKLGGRAGVAGEFSIGGFARLVLEAEARGDGEAADRLAAQAHQAFHAIHQLMEIIGGDEEVAGRGAAAPGGGDIFGSHSNSETGEGGEGRRARPAPAQTTTEEGGAK